MVSRVSGAAARQRSGEVGTGGSPEFPYGALLGSCPRACSPVRGSGLSSPWSVWVVPLSSRAWLLGPSAGCYARLALRPQLRVAGLLVTLIGRPWAAKFVTGCWRLCCYALAAAWVVSVDLDCCPLGHVPIRVGLSVVGLGWDGWSERVLLYGPSRLCGERGVESSSLGLRLQSSGLCSVTANRLRERRPLSMLLRFLLREGTGLHLLGHARVLDRGETGWGRGG